MSGTDLRGRLLGCCFGLTLTVAAVVVEVVGGVVVAGEGGVSGLVGGALALLS
jgi:hypothetical protein